MKITKTNAHSVFTEATKAAQIATNIYLREEGEHPCNCGFAWVNIKPARGPMVAYLKDKSIGHKAYESGYDVWNPSGSMTQDMSAKAQGAKAFADVLVKHGIKASARTRLD